MLNLQEEGLPIDEEFIRNRIPRENFNENILLDIVSSKPITEPQAYALELKESSN